MRGQRALAPICGEVRPFFETLTTPFCGQNIICLTSWQFLIHSEAFYTHKRLDEKSFWQRSTRFPRLKPGQMSHCTESIGFCFWFEDFLRWARCSSGSTSFAPLAAKTGRRQKPLGAIVPHGFDEFRRRGQSTTGSISL